MPAKFVAHRPYIRPYSIIETAIVRESYEKLKRERLEDVKMDLCEVESRICMILPTAHFITSKIAVFDTDNAALGGYEMASSKPRL